MLIVNVKRIARIRSQDSSVEIHESVMLFRKTICIPFFNTGSETDPGYNTQPAETKSSSFVQLDSIVEVFGILIIFAQIRLDIIYPWKKTIFPRKYGNVVSKQAFQILCDYRGLTKTCLLQ